MNRVHKLAIPVLLLMMCVALGASAQPAIKAGDGGSLPGSIDVGETFTVLITENGSPVGADISVTFMLPHDSGNPVYLSTDDNDKVRYKPLVTGTLGIRVLDGTGTVAEATVAVTDITSKTTQPSGSPSGSGDDYLPPATPTVTATTAPIAPPVATSEVTPVQRETPAAVVETPDEEGVKTPTPPPKKTPKASGFTAVSVIAGLLAALYLVLRRRE